MSCISDLRHQCLSYNPDAAKAVRHPGRKKMSKHYGRRDVLRVGAQPSPHFSYSEINALPLNGQQAVTAISALWLRRSTAFRWLQQPIGRHLMIDVVEQVIERHQEVKNEGISEIADRFGSMKVILPGMLLYALGLFATAH